MKNKTIRNILARRSSETELNAAVHQSLLAGGGTRYGRRKATVVKLATVQCAKTRTWSQWVQATVVVNDARGVTLHTAEGHVVIGHAHVKARVRHQHHREA